MSSIVLATSAEDSRAVEAVVAHHTEMNGTLGLLVEALVQAVEAGDATATTTARQRLVDWARADLLPHARAEEASMYPHAHRDPDARLLVDAMTAEHGVIGGLVDSLAGATSPVRAAALGRALQVLLEVHMTKENEQILPLLALSSDVSLASVLDGMHELLGGHEHEETGASAPAAPDSAGHSCGCGGHDDAGNLPVLDARAVPHAIRHATIFGALDGVAPGAGMVLLAPHDPLPLLAQVDARWPGTFTVDYLERGPETWALAFMR